MLSFVFGGSGSGKSSILQQRMIRESMEHPEKRYLFLVPDQFTMETQRSCGKASLAWYHEHRCFELWQAVIQSL